MCVSVGLITTYVYLVLRAKEPATYNSPRRTGGISTNCSPDVPQATSPLGSCWSVATTPLLAECQWTWKALKQADIHILFI